MTKKKKKLIIILSVFLAFVILCCCAIWQGLTVPHYTEITDKVNKSVRLCVIADLHDELYGENQEKLISKINKENPDVVLMCGDITVYTENMTNVELLLKQIAKDYPCYYVVGNHECWTGRPRTIKENFRKCSVTVLEGNVNEITLNSQTIQIGGVDDPDFFDTTKLKYGEDCPEWVEELNNCKKSVNNENYSILLSHRPEETDKYENCGFDLVLAGHAHGGQVRIPFLINGLYSPNQGVFPKYAGGQYTLSDTTDMIVSRGLTRSIYPPRVFNPPELVIVDIVPEN